MRLRSVAGLLVLAATLGAGALVATLVPAAAASARSRLASTARLEGQFQMTGQVTVARHVLGEYAGEIVTRTWTFTPLCPAGPCRRVALTRQRAAGTDQLVLHLTGVNRYEGKGRFYAPLRCGPRTVATGQSVPFTIRVKVTATGGADGVSIATRVRATYVNRKRTNLTRCVAPPAHDAAVYHGGLVL
jgi:hypothetical protein